MSDTRTRLELGGITIDSDEVSVPLVSTTYTHPALGDRPIVRLAPEPLLPAEDLTLGVSGLVAGERTPIGHTRRRAIGFPAWPILSDPPNARHALNLVADLERAARTARSKPGLAKDQIDLLINQLDASAPHFLPTFCEQAARLFLGVENRTYAVQYFGKARDAERRHGLPIDEERHREVLLEFAYAGAISAKELTTEARNLAARAEPAEAYAAFSTLCIERVKGGLLPYAGMQKDLARLARAAGGDPKAEDVRIAGELLTASSIGNAPEHFWKSYDKAIRTAGRDPEVAARLRRLTPRAFDTGPWLALLDDIGALEAVRAGEDPGFCQRLIDWNSSCGRDSTYPEAWVRLMDSPGARPPRITVDGWWLRHLPADVLDVLVSHGTEVTIKQQRYRRAELGIEDWAERADRRDLSALANDDTMAVPLVHGVLSYLGSRLSALPLIASAGTREVCVEVLTQYVTRLEEATAPAFEGLHRVSEALAAFRGSGDAEIDALVARADVILGNTEKIVADNLRLGLPEELTWPAFEQANAAASRIARRRWARGAVANWPHALVTGEQRAWVASHDTVTELVNWTGREIDKLVMVGDEVGIAYRDQHWQPRVQWAGDRKELTPEGRSWGGHTPYHVNLPVEAGRLHAEGLTRRGEAGIVGGEGHLFHDGTHYWCAGTDANQNNVSIELDPTTGRIGRTSTPDWFAEQQRRHPDHTLDPSHCQLLPVTDETAGSLFSTAEGFHRCAVLLAGGDDLAAIVVDADGTEFRYEHRSGQPAAIPYGVMRRPGGGHWLVGDHAFADAETGELVEIGSLRDVPLALFHHLTPRDEAASRAMRAATEENVAALVEAARTTGAPTDEVPDGAPDPLAAVVARELGCSDELLAGLIVQLVRGSLALRPDHVAAEAAARVEYQQEPDLAPIRDILQDAAELTRWGSMNVSAIAEAAVAVGISEGGVYGPADGPFQGAYWAWYQLLGLENGLAMLALAPGRTTDEVLALHALWREFSGNGWLAQSPSITAFTLPDSLTGRMTPGLVAENVLWPQPNRPWLVRLDGATGALQVAGETLPTDRVIKQPAGPRSQDVEGLFAVARQLAEAGERPWPVETAKRLETGLGIPYADACLILAGFPDFGTYRSWSLPAARRKAMGLTAAEAKGAHQRLKELTTGHRLGLLAAGVPADDPLRMLRDGVPDIPAMADYWRRHLGPVRTALLPPELADAMPKSVTLDDVASLFGEPISARTSFGGRIVGALWLSETLPRESELRPRLADGLTALAREDRPYKVQYSGVDAAAARTALGLPPRPEVVDTHRTWTSGPFTVEERQWTDEVWCDVGGFRDIDDPHLTLALGIEATGRPSPVLQKLLLVLDGTLAEHAQSLRTPAKGEAHDPRIAVPDLVPEVAAELGISEEAATYYLQVLTLAEPTDRNVRAWNAWKTKQITGAGAELVAKNLVVEGKRERAGRSFFLPGGWTKVADGTPMENWKLEPYRGRIIDGATAWLALGRPVAPRPLELMFAEAWERARGDDGPGFSELRTTRRRRR